MNRTRGTEKGSETRARERWIRDALQCCKNEERGGEEEKGREM